MFEQALIIGGWILIGLLSFSILPLSYKIVYHFGAFKKPRKFADAKTNHKFAIIVPARNESNVIEGLLKSLEAQDYPQELFDTYVIVESEADPTVEICKNYENVHTFVRPNLDVKTKGGAMDQLFKHLLSTGVAKEKGYEAYLIFDADNIADKNFLTEMNKTFDAGYEIALAYRNSKNWNEGWIASGSALTFSIVNTYHNKTRSRINEQILVSGTGFYIASRVIHELGGWPFQTLTEDAEVSHYAILNDIKGAYNENTQFFDTQPTKFKTSWNQRLRWIKGFLSVTNIYSPKLFKAAFKSKKHNLGKFEFGMHVLPVSIPILAVSSYAITMLVMGIVGVSIGVAPHLWKIAFINFAGILALTYLFLMFYTMLLLFGERKRIDLNAKNTFICILMNPIFMALYVPIAVAAIFKKNVTWKVIDHSIKERKSNA